MEKPKGIIESSLLRNLNRRQFAIELSKFGLGVAAVSAAVYPVLRDTMSVKEYEDIPKDVDSNSAVAKPLDSEQGLYEVSKLVNGKEEPKGALIRTPGAPMNITTTPGTSELMVDPGSFSDPVTLTYQPCEEVHSIQTNNEIIPVGDSNEVSTVAERALQNGESVWLLNGSQTVAEIKIKAPTPSPVAEVHIDSRNKKINGMGVSFANQQQGTVYMIDLKR